VRTTGQAEGAQSSTQQIVTQDARLGEVAANLPNSDL
jgi:hypothetical protein